MLITRRLGFEPKQAVEDALRSLSSRDWSADRGGLLCYLPVVRGNPFQALLYGSMDDVGMTALPTYDLPTTARVFDAVAGSGLEFVVHVHWLNVVLAKALDPGHAQEMLKEYVSELERLVDKGARVMWTAHNVLPHETRYEDLEAELRRSVVGLAERVHVMSPHTRSLAAPWFDIPASKELAVPHPAYHDVYPSWMSRAQARLELGIAPDATVLAMVGRVKPYKGLTELLDAFDTVSAAEPGRFVLLVAGPPDREEETLEFRERLLTHPSALAALKKIPDDEMQLYLRAADVAVFPYRRSLNSGALALALTFGLPVVVRSDSGEAGRLSPACHIAYSEGDLASALAETPRLCTPAARAAAASAASRIAPARIARTFAMSVRDWLDTGSP